MRPTLRRAETYDSEHCMDDRLRTSGVTVRQIAAEGNVNQEQIVIADVNLNLIEEQRLNGTVLPLNDQIRDAYDPVIHFSDN